MMRESCGRGNKHNLLFFYKGESGMTYQYVNNTAISKAFYHLLKPTTFTGRLDFILPRSFYSFKPVCFIRDYLRLDRERLGEQLLFYDSA